MTALSPAKRAMRYILVATALALPTLSLVPLGGLYLWEHGLLMWWALGALIVVGIAVLLQRSLLMRSERAIAVVAEPVRDAGGARRTAEEKAWADVQAIAASVDVEKLNSTAAVVELGQRTINTVARRIHPQKLDAIWQFTLPEALLILERVSARLGQFVETRIPFGDQLTVAQFLAVYRWRSLAGVAERAYDVWRIIRLANPAAAITNEAREHLSRALLSWGKERVSRRLAEAYVEEVGRAAIDLYRGRLHHADASGLPDVPAEAEADVVTSPADAPARGRGIWRSVRQAASASGTLAKDIIRPGKRDRRR